MRADTTRPSRRRKSGRPSFALAYHALADDWDDPLALPVERFASQIGRLHAAGYTGIRFSELAQDPDRRDVVAITFDDAFASAVEHGLPLLDRLGWTATVFAPATIIDAGIPMTWLLGRRGEAPPRGETLQPLGWDALRDLHSRGWEIGSHGATHRRLSALEPQERCEELELSRFRIEEEVGPCTSISYPWGEVVDEVVDAALRAGYSAGGGLQGRFRTGDPMRVPRFAVSRRDGALRFAAKTSQLVASVRRTAVWSGLEHLRQRDYEPAADLTSAGPLQPR